jgi:hypothetical protein
MRKERNSQVKRIAGMAAGLWLVMAAAPAFGAEPLEGLWQMISQQIGKNHVPPDPLALRVSVVNGALRFDYMVNREMLLQRTFTVHPDGTPGVITDIKGSPLGVARLSKTSATEYKLILQRPNGRPEPGKLTLANKGYILNCETDATIPGQGPSHIVQVFAKQTAVP